MSRTVKFHLVLLMAKSPPGTKSKDHVKSASTSGRGVFGAMGALIAKLRPAKPPPPEPKNLKPIPRPVEAAPIPEGWLADRPKLLETMWGAGWNLPLGEALMEDMVAAFGLTREMSVLDLAVGIGAAARAVATKYNTYVNGLETDEELALYGAAESKRQGMARTAIIKAYDPAAFDVDRRYDSIMSRELFYRVKDKRRFIRAIAASMKDYGQICWLDYLVEKSDLEKSAIAAWQAHEGNCAPMALEDVQEIWRELHYDLRIAEDITKKYMHGTLLGMAQFVKFLEGRKIAEPTKPLILAEIETWAYRLAAMKAGMKVYRFYALRK